MLIMKVKDPQLDINWQRMLKRKKTDKKQYKLLKFFTSSKVFCSRFIRLIFHVITINCNKHKIIELHLTLWLVGGRDEGGCSINMCNHRVVRILWGFKATTTGRSEQQLERGQVGVERGRKEATEGEILSAYL